MQTHVVQHAINTSSCSTSRATKASRSRQPSREWDGPPTLEGILVHCLSAWAHASCFKQERRPTTRPPCCSQNFPQRSCWTGRGTTSSNPSTCLPSIRSKRHKGLPRQRRTPRPSPSWQETGRRSKATWASGKTAPGGWTSSAAVTRSAATPPPIRQASLQPRYVGPYMLEDHRDEESHFIVAVQLLGQLFQSDSDEVICDGVQLASDVTRGITGASWPAMFMKAQMTQHLGGEAAPASSTCAIAWHTPPPAPPPTRAPPSTSPVYCPTRSPSRRRFPPSRRYSKASAVDPASLRA